MSKHFITFIISVVTSVITFVQGSFAVTVSAPNVEDFTVTLNGNNATYNISDFSNVLNLDNDNKKSSLCFLMFDIGNIAKGTTINSARLNLFGNGSNDIEVTGNGNTKKGIINNANVIEGPVTAELYYVTNDSITNGGKTSYINSLLSSNPIASYSFRSITDVPVSLSLTNLNDLSSDIKSGNKYFSVALKLSGNGVASFNSMNAVSNVPDFTVDTATPAPEASLIFLGLISFVSVIGFRRKI